MEKYDFDQEQILKRIAQQVTTILTKMKLNNLDKPELIFFDNSEFQRVMNISPRLCQRWRDENIINYSMIGSKIYYTLADIQNLLNNNKKTKPFNGTDI
jgi:hypothetical protein